MPLSRRPIKFESRKPFGVHVERVDGVLVGGLTTPTEKVVNECGPAKSSVVDVGRLCSLDQRCPLVFNSRCRASRQSPNGACECESPVLSVADKQDRAPSYG